MLKLFENRFIDTTNKLAVSIADIKRGRFGGKDEGRDGGGGGASGGAGTTQDVMSVLKEQHNSLLLVLAAQTQKLDNLEQICLHRTRSDEQRECSGEPPRSEVAPKIDQIHQLVNLKERLADAEAVKERLADAEAELLDLRDDLEEEKERLADAEAELLDEKSRVEELQGRLRSAQQALDESARERRHSSSKGRSCLAHSPLAHSPLPHSPLPHSPLAHSPSKNERFQAVLQQRLHRSAPVIGGFVQAGPPVLETLAMRPYASSVLGTLDIGRMSFMSRKSRRAVSGRATATSAASAGGDALPRRAPPLTAASTDGMREGTPTVLHMQAELVHTSNHTGKRGRGRDTERPRVSNSRARALNSLGRSLGNELETIISDKSQAQLDTMFQRPFSAKSTGGMRGGTSTVMHMLAELPELAQTNNHNGERGRGSDTERRARAWFREGSRLSPRTSRGPA